MLHLIRHVAEAAKGDLNLDWLKPLGLPRHVKARAPLFRKGDPADRMAFVLSGTLRIAAPSIDLGPGEVVASTD